MHPYRIHVRALTAAVLFTITAIAWTWLVARPGSEPKNGREDCCSK